MARYVALLRAINVGGRTVRMAELREHFERMAFTGISTFLASGNVIFETRRTAERTIVTAVERELRRALGYDVATFIRTVPELAGVAVYKPFAPARLAAAGSSLYVIFVADAITGAMRRKLLALRTDVDDFRAHGREVYWYCRGKLTDSQVKSPALARALGVPSTMRNVTTIRKLVARYRER